jgi:CBS domain-containing protein
MRSGELSITLKSSAFLPIKKNRYAPVTSQCPSREFYSMKSNRKNRMEHSIEFAARNNLAAGESRKPTSATRVAEVMSTNLVTLSAHHTFGEAVQLMTNSPFRHFLVVHADGRLAGVFSDRDVLRALGRTPNWQAKNVSGVMTHKVFTVTPETPLSVAASEMLSRRINCLPVIGDDGKVCGIITSTDLLRSYQKIQSSLENNSRGANTGSV